MTSYENAICDVSASWAIDEAEKPHQGQLATILLECAALSLLAGEPLTAKGYNSACEATRATKSDSCGCSDLGRGRLKGCMPTSLFYWPPVLTGGA